MESFISIPFRIDEATNGVSTSTSPAQKYRQFMAAVLTTHYKERVMRPAYGSSLTEYMFMPNIDNSPADQFVREALAKWVPDITVVSVVEIVDPDSGKITINVTYSLPDTSTQTLVLFQDNIGDIGDGDVRGATRFAVKIENLDAPSLYDSGTYDAVTYDIETGTKVILPTGQVIYE